MVSNQAHQVEAKDIEREVINAQIDAYLADGGEIDYLPAVELVPHNPAWANADYMGLM